MASTEWYFSRNNQQEGPVTLEALAEMARSGALQPAHLVWSAGMTEWQPAGRVPGIFPAAPPAAAQPAYAAPAAYTQSQGSYGQTQAAYAAQQGYTQQQGYAQQGYVPPYAAAHQLGYAAAQVRYAGFWIRVLAYIIDGIILGIVVGIISGVLSVAMHQNTSSFQFGPNAFPNQAMNGKTQANPVFSLVTMLFYWLYFAVLESSAMQATFGKQILGLKVTDLNGNRIGFGKATGRYFAKIISGLLLCIGFMMVGWTQRKQGLHDMMASTLVVHGKPV